MPMSRGLFGAGWKASRRFDVSCRRSASSNAFIGTVKVATATHKDFVAVKDNIATLEQPTTCASETLARYNSPYEASVVEQLRENGWTVFGKTNMDEFGMGSHSTNSKFGPVRNHEDFSAGGSSGGSAVAVATGATRLSIGTDTGGSVRLPAAYNGVAGFKPSFGRISRHGVVPYANSLDTVGIFAKNSTTIAQAFAPLSRHDPQDPTSITDAAITRFNQTIRNGALESNRWTKVSSKTLKIGVPIEYNIEELEEGVRSAWRGVLDKLCSQGHDIVPISLPSTKHALSAYYVLAPAEAASNLAKYDGVRYGTRSVGNDGDGGVLYAKTRGDGFGDEVRRRILLGSYTLSSEAIDNYFIQAQRVRRLVQQDFDRVFSMPNPLHDKQQFDLSAMVETVKLQNKLGPAQVDVIVCPTAPTTAPLLSAVAKQTTIDAYMNDVFTVPASLAGLPAISVPVSLPQEYSEPGRPNKAGIQVIGQYWDDSYVLETAGLIESDSK